MAAGKFKKLMSQPTLFSTVKEIKAFLTRCRRNGQSIGFVPTMGALHQGHLSLVRLAKAHADITVVSIFVNPAQFAPHEDFETYPRLLQTDTQKLAPLGVACVFAPTVSEIYPSGEGLPTRVECPGLSETLCGVSRPQFFSGVCTVVLRLFNIVQPDVAVFGEKDYQQLLVVQKMVHDLHLDIKIIPGPIVRETDGLAMSSRNAYLSQDERAQAVQIYHMLNAANQTFANGCLAVNELLQTMTGYLAAHSAIQIDYLNIVDPKTLQPRETVAHPGDRIVFAGFCGKTRLIDNWQLIRS